MRSPHPPLRLPPVQCSIGNGVIHNGCGQGTCTATIWTPPDGLHSVTGVGSQPREHVTACKPVTLGVCQSLTQQSDVCNRSTNTSCEPQSSFKPCCCHGREEGEVELTEHVG